VADRTPSLPELTPSPRVEPAALRRRGIRVGLLVGAVLLLVAGVATVASSAPDPRPVVLSAPRGSRVAIDGDPQPSLGSDGTHLLQLRPGHHDVEVTLRTGAVVSEQVDIGEGEGSLLLRMRYDRVAARWELFVDDRQ